MLATTKELSLSAVFRKTNLLCLSEMNFTILISRQGLISLETPLLSFVPWLKNALQPHSFSRMISRSYRKNETNH